MYCKDVFAVPGRINDKHSAGCNSLIANHKADLLFSTDYFLQQMGWDKKDDQKKNRFRQQELFIELNPDEQKVIDALKNNSEGLHIDSLAIKTEIPTYQLFSILLQLEMKNLIKNLPGNIFRLY